VAFGAASVAAQAPAAQQPPDPAVDALRAGQQLMRDGKAEEALASYRKVAEQFPTAAPVQIRLGIQLDLMGRYAEARTHLAKALTMPLTPAVEAQALRAMAISYAFENNCAGAIPHEQKLFDRYVANREYVPAAEIGTELARVCLEAGDFDTAAAWYKKAVDTARLTPDLSAAAKDLWQFRWEHAQARLAARRGNKTQADVHIKAAKAALDTGTNPDQAPFFPYLVGYVAFYTGDTRTALAELLKGNMNDPFVLALIAQAHEKLGDQAAATDFYTKVLASTAHNPNNAYARPLARKKLGR
jgi:tetratricopeptide (TPR) repeat protein